MSDKKILLFYESYWAGEQKSFFYILISDLIANFLYHAFTEISLFLMNVRIKFFTVKHFFITLLCFHRGFEA